MCVVMEFKQFTSTTVEKYKRSFGGYCVSLGKWLTP